MTNFYDWSETAASNASADETINFAEFQNPDTVNDSARAMMARLAAWRKDNAPTRTSTGSGNAYAVTSQAGGSTGYQDGEIVCFIADRANTGACTLNVNSRGAVAFRPAVGVAFSANEILANQPIFAFYRASTNEWLAVGTGYHVTSMTAGALTQSIAARLIKIGTPVLSIAPSPNTGYIRLTESTQTVNKADWPELSSYLSGLSTPYPWGSTSTTFSLPPAAGYVLRFAATSSTVDTSGARTAGSTQSDQNKAHTHTFTGTTGSGGGHTHTVTGATTANASNGGDSRASVSSNTTSSDGVHTHAFSGTTESSGGDEVRVKNVAMHVDVFASSQLSAGTIGMFGWPFSWDTGTTAADPGTARVRGNNASMASITALYISETDGWGVNIGPLLNAFEAGDTIRLSKIGSQANTFVATVSGSITDAGTYRVIPVTVLVTNGSFSNSDTLALELTGGVGAPGLTIPDISGLTVLPTASLASDDKLVVYDQSTVTTKATYFPFLGSTGSNDNAVLRADGTTGGLIQASDVYITDAGRLGVGTASPESEIEALKAQSGGLGARLLLKNSAVEASGNYTGVAFTNTDGASGYIKGGIFYASASPYSYGRGDFYFCQNSVTDSSNATLSDAKMVLGNTGKMGFGGNIDAYLNPSSFIFRGANGLDNVISVQNTTADTAGQSAIRFLEYAGTERGAIGYGCLRGADFFFRTMYIEMGALGDSTNPTDFAIVNTDFTGLVLPAVGQYKAMDVDADGKITFNQYSHSNQLVLTTGGNVAIGASTSTTKLGFGANNSARIISLYENGNAKSTIGTNDGMTFGVPGYGGGANNFKFGKWSTADGTTFTETMRLTDDGALSVIGDVQADTISVNDSNDSHQATIAIGSDLSADRTITVTMPDANTPLNLITPPRGVTGYITNRYYSGEFLNPGATGTLTLTANTLYAAPLSLGKRTTWTRIGVDVTTLAAGNARVGLYYADGSGGVPGTLLLDAGTVSTGSTGVKEVTISQALDPGFYWFALVSDATATIRAVALGGAIPGVAAPGTTDSQYTIAHTYGALPNPFGSGTWAAANTPIPLLRVV